jgi:hypothetical protein
LAYFYSEEDKQSIKIMKHTYRHSTEKSLNGKQIFLGILLAAAYGFTVGVLFTPMSGEDTRKRLKHFMD